jgi:hypothetical protein
MSWTCNGGSDPWRHLVVAVAVALLCGCGPAETPFAFVILCNHHHTDSDNVRAAQDAIVNALARTPTGR